MKGDEQLVGRVESFKNEFGRFALGKSKKTGRTEFRGHFVKMTYTDRNQNVSNRVAAGHGDSPAPKC
jgi:hypothetical protein